VPKPTFLNLPDEKRQRIAEVAVEEFARRPYAQFSISRLVAAAGIAKGSFYQYFEDKLDLYRWIVLDYLATRKLTFLRADPPPEGAGYFEQLEHIFLVALRFGLAHPHLSRAATAVWHPDPADEKMSALAAELQAMARANMRAILQQGVDGGHLRRDLDLDLGTELIVTMAGPGLDMALRRKLGVDLLEFCARPELADRFPEAEQRKLIGGLLSILREGMQPPGPPAANAATIDLDVVPFPARPSRTEGNAG